MAKRSKDTVKQHFKMTESGPVFKGTGKSMSYEEYRLLQALMILGIGRTQALSTLAAQLHEGRKDDAAVNNIFNTATNIRNRQNVLFGGVFRIEITGAGALDEIGLKRGREEQERAFRVVNQTCAIFLL